MTIFNPWVSFSKHPFDLYDNESPDSRIQITSIALSCHGHDYSTSSTCSTTSGSSDIIAIAFANGRISFFDSTGNKHPTWSDIASSEAYYTTLSWKPPPKNNDNGNHNHNSLLLIGGRADGQIATWGKEMKGGDGASSNNSGSNSGNNSGQYNIGTNDEAHQCGISKLLWNHSTSNYNDGHDDDHDIMNSSMMSSKNKDHDHDHDDHRLLSIDVGGACCIWRVHEHDSCNPGTTVGGGGTGSSSLVGMMHFDTNVQMTAAVFVSSHELQYNQTNAFFLGSIDGKITYHDENGQSQIVVDPLYVYGDNDGDAVNMTMDMTMNMSMNVDYDSVTPNATTSTSSVVGVNNAHAISHIFCDTNTNTTKNIVDDDDKNHSHSIIAITNSMTMIKFHMEKDGSNIIQSRTKLDLNVDVDLGSTNNVNDNISTPSTCSTHLRHVIFTNRGGQLVVLTSHGQVIGWDTRRGNERYILRDVNHHHHHDHQHPQQQQHHHHHDYYHRAVSIHFASHLGVLVVGTEDGQCIFWEECLTDMYTTSTTRSREEEDKDKSKVGGKDKIAAVDTVMDQEPSSSSSSNGEFHPTMTTVNNYNGTCTSSSSSQNQYKYCSRWRKVFHCDLSEYNIPIDSIYYGGKNVLVHSPDNSTVMISLKEEMLQFAHGDGKAAMQIDHHHQGGGGGDGGIVLYNDHHNDGQPMSFLQTYTHHIRGIAIDSRYVCMWSHDDVQIYIVEDDRCEMYAEIPISIRHGCCLVLYDESLYVVQMKSPRSLLVTDLYGAQRLTIRFPEDQGCPKFLDVASDCLIIVTDLGTIKIMDITRKEPRQVVCHEKEDVVKSGFPLLDTVVSIKSNADCSILAVLSMERHGSSTHRSRLHFFDLDDCTSQEATVLHDADFITSHCWDLVEPKLFACEVRSRDIEKPKVLTMFVSEGGKALIHDECMLDSHSSKLMGLAAPFRFVSSTEPHNDQTSYGPRTERRIDSRRKEIITGFEDSVGEGASSISAIVNISYYIASGDIDTALICAEPLNTTQVWMRMAKASMTFKRLDIAKLCLSKMGYIAGLKTVHQAEIQSGTDVALAEVAIQLGMQKHAETLYRECHRLDLLCELFRGQGLWENAFDIAKDNELLQQSLHFHYGKFLELNGNIKDALDHYEKSSLPKERLLQKMIKHGLPLDLYLQRTKDNDLIKHYASYVESTGNIDLAKELYSTTADHLSLVRLACLEGDLEQAYSIVRENNCKAGAYHLARHIEASGDVAEALKCYSMSGMYNYAMRLAKSHGSFDDDLVDMLMKQTESPLAIECAHYFLDKGQLEYAARVFNKVGEKGKAIEIILKIPFNDSTCHVYAEYASLIEELNVDVSNEVIQKCAKFLITTENADRALNMLKAKGYSFQQLLRFFKDEQITLNEKLVDSLIHDGANNRDILDIARLSRKQGNFILASQKYTQGGDRISAMKCLLCIGDEEKIISFANESDSRDTYVLAANYIQSLDDKKDPVTKKTILEFYTKAEANREIVGLLSSWSAAEAEVGDYERALAWLNESRIYAKKTDSEQILNELDRKVQIIGQFLEAREISSSDPSQTRKICMHILDKDDGSTIKLGDCYALLLEIENDFERSLKYIEAMCRRGVDPEDFIEEETIFSIYQAVGKDLGTMRQVGNESKENLN